MVSSVQIIRGDIHILRQWHVQYGRIYNARIIRLIRTLHNLHVSRILRFEIVEYFCHVALPSTCALFKALGENLMFVLVFWPFPFWTHILSMRLAMFLCATCPQMSAFSRPSCCQFRFVLSRHVESKKWAKFEARMLCKGVARWEKHVRALRV